MIEENILNQVKTLKNRLQNDGFIIDGIFGSYARGESLPNSDIDLLYHLDSRFFDNYVGFMGFKKLEEIKNYISEILKKKLI